MMKSSAGPIVFGPVRSRRLGFSIGIMNVFPKVCAYSCIYCQLGRTKHPNVARSTFYNPGAIYEACRLKIDDALKAGLIVDYLTFVPTGEAAHDENLGHAIHLLRSLGIKIAIISNATLLSKDRVVKDFLLADFVSLKIDSVVRETWQTINRPSPRLAFEDLLRGILAFRKKFEGVLVTESMFVKGINDNYDEAGLLADYIYKVRPDIAYIALPIRSPAEKWVDVPDEADLVEIHDIFNKKIKTVKYLLNYQKSYLGPDDKKAGSNISDISGSREIGEDKLKDMLEEARAEEYLLNEVIIRNQIIKAHHVGEPYHVVET